MCNVQLISQFEMVNAKTNVTNYIEINETVTQLH